MGGTPSKRMLMLIMQLPPGSSKYRICPFITEKTVLSGNYIQVDIDKLCRVRATTQCAFGVSWSNPRAVGLVQKNCIFSPWVLLLTQELNLSHLLSLLRARYITTSKGEGGMNRSIGSGSIGQYTFSAPLTNSKGSGAEHKALTWMYVSVLFL